MRVMTWLLGIMLLLAWHDVLAALGRGVGGWYITYAVLWFLAGGGALLTGVIRLVLAKVKAGALGVTQAPGAGAPATHKGG